MDQPSYSKPQYIPPKEALPETVQDKIRQLKSDVKDHVLSAVSFPGQVLAYGAKFVSACAFMIGVLGLPVFVAKLCGYGPAATLASDLAIIGFGSVGLVVGAAVTTAIAEKVINILQTGVKKKRPITKTIGAAAALAFLAGGFPACSIEQGVSAMNSSISGVFNKVATKAGVEIKHGQKITSNMVNKIS